MRDANGNVLTGYEVIYESADYTPNNRLFSVGHMVYRDITVVKTKDLGAFPSSIYYSKKEAGYTTPFTGTLYLKKAWSQSNGSYEVYYGQYKGTVAAYLG